MKLELLPTEGNALDPKALKKADDLPVDAVFFDAQFVEENPLERAGVILEIEPEAKDLLERELGYHMNPDAPNYRSVLQLTDDLAVQIMCNGIATYSNLEQQLFEVDILRKSNGGELAYWTNSPFLPSNKQVAEMQDAHQVEELLNQIKSYKGSIADE